MCRCKIEFTLKSGNAVTVYYDSEESNLGMVAESLLLKPDNNWHSFMSADGDNNILVKVGEVAAVNITKW